MQKHLSVMMAAAAAVVAVVAVAMPHGLSFAFSSSAAMMWAES